MPEKELGPGQATHLFPYFLRHLHLHYSPPPRSSEMCPCLDLRRLRSNHSREQADLGKSCDLQLQTGPAWESLVLACGPSAQHSRPPTALLQSRSPAVPAPPSAGGWAGAGTACRAERFGRPGQCSVPPPLGAVDILVTGKATDSQSWLQFPGRGKAISHLHLGTNNEILSSVSRKATG